MNGPWRKKLLSVLEKCAVNETRKDAGQRLFRTMFTAEATANGVAGFYHDVLRDPRPPMTGPNVPRIRMRTVTFMRNGRGVCYGSRLATRLRCSPGQYYTNEEHGPHGRIARCTAPSARYPRSKGTLQTPSPLSWARHVRLGFFLVAEA